VETELSPGGALSALQIEQTAKKKDEEPGTKKGAFIPNEKTEINQRTGCLCRPKQRWGK
jgi:hypothetical protein